MFPTNWFWLADDGRVFASARNKVVSDKDPAFLEAQEAGQQITRWPADDSGAQTTASLKEVLRPYGIWVDLADYAANARWRSEVGGVTVNGVTIATDDRSKVMLMGARITAAADPSFTTPWVAADGVTHQLTAAEVIAISDAVLAHVATCFATFDSVKTEIASGEITTAAEIDAAFADAA